MFRFAELADAIGFIFDVWVAAQGDDPDEEDLELYLSIFGLDE